MYVSMYEICKMKRKKYALTKPCETTSKDNIEFVKSLLGRGFSIRSTLFPSETLLEKTQFSFACGYPWQIASGLGWGLVPLSAGTPSGTNLCSSHLHCK